MVSITMTTPFTPHKSQDKETSGCLRVVAPIAFVWVNTAVCHSFFEPKPGMGNIKEGRLLLLPAGSTFFPYIRCFFPYILRGGFTLNLRKHIKVK